MGALWPAGRISVKCTFTAKRFIKTWETAIESMFTKHNSIKTVCRDAFYCGQSNFQGHYSPWRQQQVEKGDGRSSGLQNWQAEAPVTGCQFIGHHLVSQDGRDRLHKENRIRTRSRTRRGTRGAEGSRCARWISAGNSTSTGTHIQLPHGVAVTSSAHQKAQNRRYLQVRWARLRGGFGAVCHLETKEEERQSGDMKSGFGRSYIGPGRRSLVTRQFPPPCFIARSKRHHCLHANSLAKGPRPE